jgi:hypothetical protein
MQVKWVSVAVSSLFLWVNSTYADQAGNGLESKARSSLVYCPIVNLPLGASSGSKINLTPPEISRYFSEREGSEIDGRPAINFEKAEIQENEKWNPVLKYTLVMLIAGVGTTMIYHGIFHDVGKSSCNDVEDPGSGCIPDRAVGFVIGGLVLSVVSIGIAKKF